MKTLQKTEIQGKHLVWTVGNGNLMHGVCMGTARVKQEVGAEESQTRPN